MEQKKQDIIFVDGYETKYIPETAPDYILGKGSINVEKMIEFLTKYKPLAVSGYLNFETKRSKTTGKRYTQLDLYRFNQQPDQVKQDALINLQNQNYQKPTEQGIDYRPKVDEERFEKMSKVYEDYLIQQRNPGYPTPTEQGLNMQQMEKIFNGEVSPENKVVITPEMLDVNPDDIPF